MDILDAGSWQHRGETEDGIVELGDADEASDGKMLESEAKVPSQANQDNHERENRQTMGDRRKRMAQR